MEPLVQIRIYEKTGEITIKSMRPDKKYGYKHHFIDGVLTVVVGEETNAAIVAPTGEDIKKLSGTS